MAKKVDLSDTSESFLKLLIYGQAGSTKTRTCATACNDERTSPVLWFDIGGNPQSIRHNEVLPDIIKITKLEDFNPFYNWLVDGQPENNPVVDMFDLKPPYKSVVIDGITSVQRLSFAVVTQYKEPQPGSIPPGVEIQHFNKVLAQMTWFGWLWLPELPMHVIITALEAEKTDQYGAVYYRPLLWGQSAGEIPGMALIVARMFHESRIKGREKVALRGYEEEVHSLAVFKPGPYYVAKDQFHGTLTYMPNPTITRILDGDDAAGRSGDS